MLDYSHKTSEFELQSSCDVNFQSNTLGLVSSQLYAGFNDLVDRVWMVHGSGGHARRLGWWLLGLRGLSHQVFTSFGRTKFIARCLRCPSWGILAEPRTSGTAGHALFGPCPAPTLKKAFCHTSSWRGNEQIPSRPSSGF